MNLLAGEIMARTGRDPAEEYRGLEDKFGRSHYLRLDIPALAPQREVLKKLSPEKVKAGSLAGEPILAIMTRAPGNEASIGGIKVTASNGWFAARPSGTEDIYKIYAESFKGEKHLQQIVEEAQDLVKKTFAEAGV
jgi:phosphoglucomutase